MSKPKGGMPSVTVRGFFPHLDPPHRNLGEWEAAQRRLRITNWTGHSVLYVAARVTARYWITYAKSMGRIHLATGRGVREINASHPFWPDRIVVEVHCRTALGYPRPIASPDAAPGFDLCPRCIDAAYADGDAELTSSQT